MRRGGNALIDTAVMFALLVGIASLSIDYGLTQLSRNEPQSAADAGGPTVAWTRFARALADDRSTAKGSNLAS